MTKNPIARLLVPLCSVGLLVGGGIHFATYANFSFPASQNWLFALLHVGAIASVGLFVLTQRERLKQANASGSSGSSGASLPLPRPLWGKLLLFLLVAYTAFNFFTNAGAGRYQQIKGKYVTTYRGTVKRTFPNKESFLKAKKTAEVRTLRAFSGHWLMFFGGVLLLLLLGPSAESKPSEEKNETPSVPLPTEGMIAQAPEPFPTLFERLKVYPPFKALAYFMGIQIFLALIVSVIAIVKMPDLLGLIGVVLVVLSFGLFGNLVYYRRWLKHYLTAVAFKQDHCMVQFQDGNTPRTAEIPYNALRVRIDTESVRNNPIHFLAFLQYNVPICRQLCHESSLWTLERAQEIVKSWEAKQRA